MKALVIYDSLYGNTEQIAKAIGQGIGEDAKVVRSAEADINTLGEYELIVIGAPTQAGRPMKPMQEFLDKLPPDALKDKKVASFDTRMPAKWVKIFGYAAPRIEKVLKQKGGNLVAPAEGFFVKGTKGPLAEGELERAANWAKTIAAK